MMPFSEFQKEELCYKINVRIETVNVDPESGTDLEIDLAHFNVLGSS